MEENKSAIFLESVSQPFWAMSAEEVFAVLATGSSGLDEEEAERRRLLFGPNVIRAKAGPAKLKIVLNQLKSPLILVLIIAGLITIFLREWINAGVIFAAVLVNTFLGFWQENKAETALELLKSYIHTRARVRREGQEREIDAKDLVPGDKIRITQGDRVPADARLIFVKNLEVDEAILTGESLPVEKNTAPLPASAQLHERTSTIFSGTLVTQGFGDAVVTSTGDATEFGRIAGLVAKKEREPTPLQRSTGRFIFRAGIILGVLTCLLFGLGLYFGYELFDMFLIAVAVAVSAVPEGLPVALTVILAVGVERLARRKGVVRRLLAAETLGSTSIILTDKTGTLTQAKMELMRFIPWNTQRKDDLLSYAVLNSDVIIENSNESPENWQIAGRALEVALARGAAKEGVFLPQVFKEYEILDRLPFSSADKFSATIVRCGQQSRLILFGAPEILLRYTTLQDQEAKKVLMTVDEYAYAGGRVLAVASREILPDHEDILHNHRFDGLSFYGLLVFRDPLRPHVEGAIRSMAGAGVKTVIVTGDHRGTAEAVARSLGMIDGKGAVLTGDDLTHLGKEELMARASRVSVYTRVTPEQKLMLTRLYQEKGEVVAVIGDGVNDAPALQAADIGVAVGSGTDVAKSVADLVLLDDDFVTLVAAVEEGRRILGNIRKVIVYLLSDSLDELFLIGGALLTGLVLPINALQILFVNFFSDSFPALALAFEKEIDGFGSRPRKLDRNLFDREMQLLVLVIGVSTSFLLFLFYYLLLRFGFPAETVRTFIFASFATYTLFLAFSIRNLEKSVLSYNPFSNPHLVGGVGVGLLLTALVIYFPPLQKIFDTVALPPLWIFAVLAVGTLNIAAVEFGKWLFRKQMP